MSEWGHQAKGSPRADVVRPAWLSGPCARGAPLLTCAERGPRILVLTRIKAAAGRTCSHVLAPARRRARHVDVASEDRFDCRPGAGAQVLLDAGAVPVSRRRAAHGRRPGPGTGSGATIAKRPACARHGETATREDGWNRDIPAPARRAEIPPPRLTGLVCVVPPASAARDKPHGPVRSWEEKLTPIRRAAAATLILSLVGPAAAAELKVLSIPGVRAAVNELVPQFERDTGDKVTIRYEIYPGQKREIESGDFDVAIFSSQNIGEMIKQGRIVPGSTADIGRTSIGVAVRQGAPKPVVDTEDAFKRTLLAAKSITYTKDSATGTYVTRLLDRLGLTDAIKDKLKLQPGGNMTAPAVAKGEAELAIVLVSDILATPGVDLVGPLPPTLLNSVTQTAALGIAAKQPAAGTAFIKFLSSPAAASAFRSKGLDPAAP